MQIIKEKLDINDELKNKINNILKFSNTKEKIVNGNIIHISKTNISYIEPHKLIINDKTYLFFNDYDFVFIDNLENKISFNELKKLVKNENEP